MQEKNPRMHNSHDLPALHSNLFPRSKQRQIPVKIQPNSSGYSFEREDFTSAATELLDEPPPLTFKHTDSQFHTDKIPTNIRRANPSSGSGNLTDGLVVSTYDHHCKYSFMRSQLSRLLGDGQCADIFCISPYSEPKMSDFIGMASLLDQESTDRLMGILSLRIRNS